MTANLLSTLQGSVMRDPVESAVCMGMDAMRIALGQPTRNFAPDIVAKFIAFRAKEALDGTE